MGLVLVKRGSPRQAIFQDINLLWQGKVASGKLTSSQGKTVLGFQYFDEQRAGEWRYIESTSVSSGSNQAIQFQYIDNNFLKVVGRDLVFDVAFWDMKENQPVNFVGGDSASKTKSGGGGRDWTINNDGTISAKHHPHFVLGLSEAPQNISGLCLVSRGSPFQAVFEDMELLWQGKVASAKIKSNGSNIAVGKAYLKENRHEEWRYIESQIVDADSKNAIKFEYVDNAYLKLVDADLVLDVSFWKFNEGTTVNFVGGNSPSRTKLGGGGRDWTLNNDGTISVKKHPHLVLGFGSNIRLVARGSPQQAVFQDIGALKAGKVVPAKLTSHGGSISIGKQYNEERKHDVWRYIESQCVSNNSNMAIKLQYIDNNYLKVADKDLVLDVSFWKMIEGNTVNFVGSGAGHVKTKQGGGGRDWTLNNDGTISAKHHPHLVLGF